MLARIAFVVVLLSSAGPAFAGGGASYLIGHQYRDFPLSVSPFSVAAGPDGAIWYADGLNAEIGRITLDGTVKSYPLEGSASTAYALRLGPDGNLWFLDGNQESIGRITPGGMVTEFPVPGRPFLGDLAAGPDGNLWFTNGIVLPDLIAGGEPEGGTIGRITPNGTVSLFPTMFTTNSITAGPDRALWVTSFDRIGRVTTSAQDQYFEVDTRPLFITAGADGALWFTADCRDILPVGPAGVPTNCGYGIGRLTTGGQLTKFPQVDAVTRPFFIVRGPEDNLWFTRERGVVSRLTPAGRVDDVVLFDDANGLATELTVGPDGALWFGLPSSQRIARVSSLAYDFLDIANSGPLGMAPGLNGSVWFTDADGNRVGRVSPGGGLVQYELGDTHGPTGIAAAPDGGAYFTNFDAGTIGRITPDGDFVEYALPFPDDLPEEIVLGPDGNYWFTIDVNSIGRITPQGAVKIFPTPTEDAGPLGIAVGPDGNLWFTEMLVNKIGRMTTDGDAEDFPIPTADSEPWDIAASPDGNLYFTESRTGRIARITTEGRITELGVANPVASPRDIAVGPDGAMWFSIVPMSPPAPVDPAAEVPRPRIAEDPTPTPTLGPARVGRLAHDGRITSFDITKGLDDPNTIASPAGIAGSGDGRLFVALYDAASIAVLDIVSAQPVPTATPTFEDFRTETPTEPTGEATATPTQGEPGATPTPTEGEPGATPTPTEFGSEATETPTPEGGVCAGDCNGDGAVSISELITAVNIALGARSIDTCNAVDANGDGEVRISELITAVSRALNSC
jgi:streptogramin lyase